jgi:hypothetical protein
MKRGCGVKGFSASNFRQGRMQIPGDPGDDHNLWRIVADATQFPAVILVQFRRRFDGYPRGPFFASLT